MYLYNLFEGHFMKSLNYLLIAITITSTVFAADQSSAASIAMESFTQASMPRCYVRTYEQTATGELTGIAIDTEYPPKDRKINLSQLFASDTGHPKVDDRAFELTKLLLSNEDKIKAFRALPEELQVKASVDVFMFSCKGTLDDEEFKKRCDELLSGSTKSLSHADYVVADDSQLFTQSAGLEQDPA